MGFVKNITRSIFGGGKTDTSGMQQSADTASAIQEKIYQESVSRGDPLYQAGLGGLEALQSGLGLAGDTGAKGYGQFTKQYGPEQLTEDPGFKFRQKYGEEAIQRQLAAQGKTMDPEAVKALMEYNQGLASQEYGAGFSRNRAEQTDLYNRLAGISGVAQQQAGQLGQLGQQYAGNVGDIGTSLAQAQAGARQADKQRKQSMWGTLIGGGARIGAAIYSDKTLKENIELVGEQNGHNIYQFNYIGEPQRYEGVIAQEVLKTNPGAVTTRNGKLAVYYDKLGLEMREIN